jgi:hypothetical protein
MIDKGGTPEGDPETFTATTHYVQGRWTILVHLPRPDGARTPEWPRHQWAKRAAAPSMSARVEALALLGYEPAGEWLFSESEHWQHKYLAEWGLVVRVRVMQVRARTDVAAEPVPEGMPT